MRAHYGLNSILWKMMPIGVGAMEILCVVAPLNKSHDGSRDIDLFRCAVVAEIIKKGIVSIEVYANGLIHHKDHG